MKFTIDLSCGMCEIGVVMTGYVWDMFEIAVIETCLRLVSLQYKFLLTDLKCYYFHVLSDFICSFSILFSQIGY